MKIKTELLKSYISDYVVNQINDFEIDADKITDTVATKVLAEIQAIIKNDKYDDFEMVENIVRVFEENNIDFGNLHDY